MKWKPRQIMIELGQLFDVILGQCEELGWSRSELAFGVSPELDEGIAEYKGMPVIVLRSIPADQCIIGEKDALIEMKQKEEKNGH